MMKNFGDFFKSYRWAFLSGVLFGTSYVPFPPWAVLFCLTPLWLWLHEDASSRKQAFIGGWITQFVLTLIGFHWIAHTAREFGGFPWPVAIATVLLFAALMHLYIPLAMLATYELKTRLKLKAVGTLFTAAIMFSLFERIWPTIFPFHLGYTMLWSKIPIYQWADTIGFEGISSLLLLANAWIGYIWLKQDQTETTFRNVLALFSIIIVLTVGGIFKKRAWKETDSEINPLVVQANIGNLEKVYAEKGKGYQDEIITRFVNQSRAGLQEHSEADMMVWPETALPTYPDRIDKAGRHLNIITAGLVSFGRPILTGAFSKDPDPVGGGSPAEYNALFLLDGDGRIHSGPYRKTYLLAFGEYLPWSEEFPILLKWLPFISNFGRGHGPKVLEWRRPNGQDPVKFGAQICYEGLFPSFSRGLAEAGAEVLVNVTNDSWFGTPFEPRQHMIMTLARAIETRRPLIRSTNTGISTAILATGEQLPRSPSGKEWAGTFKIPFKKSPDLTIFTVFGHWDWVLLLIGLGAVIYRGRRNSGIASA